MPSWATWLGASGTWSLAEIEERLTGRALAWVGGAALILGAILFISLAFTNGWIGPEGRVVIGLVAGATALVAGALFLERDDRLLGHVLTPVGLAVITISLVGATRLYDLVPVPIGLAIALVAAVGTAAIAIRSNAQIIAAFGLVAVLAAPPLLGASPDTVTLAFIGVALVGTTTIALWRSWSWLPPIAFVLSAPQAASWLLGESDVAVGLVGLAAFSVLHTVAAGGEEFRLRRDDLHPSSATVMLADAAFTIWAGFVLLDGTLELWRGLFLIVVALSYLGLGSFFLVRDGERHLFGLLAAGTGIAALTMAAPVQLGAPWVPVAWTAEAAVLAWIAAERAHPYSAFVSAILYGLAAAQLVGQAFGPAHVPAEVPFVSPEGASLAFFLAGVAAGVAAVPERVVRSALVASGVAVTTACVAAELDGPAAVAAWMIVAVAGSAVLATLPRMPERRIPWKIDGLIPTPLRDPGPVPMLARLATPAAILLTVGLATTTLLLDVYAPWSEAPAGVPFGDLAGAALGVYLVALGLIGAMARSTDIRAIMAALGIVVVAWACPSRLDGVILVAAWAALAPIGLVIARLLGIVTRSLFERAITDGTAAPWPPAVLLPAASVVAATLAVGHVLTIELPVAEFGSVLPPTVPFSDAGAASAAVLAATALAAGWLLGSAAARRVGVIAAGAVIAYAIPFEVYAWAVALLWVTLAVAAIVAGRLDRAWLGWWRPTAAIMLGLTAAVAVGIVAPPSRLVVADGGIESLHALQSAAALGAIVVGLGVFAWSESDRWARLAAVLGGIGLVYLSSVAVVDLFAVRVGGDVPVEDLQKQAQVALSVLWTVLGAVAFVAGLWTRRLELRQGGLAMLAIATAKVFLVDLSALDVAYRVISLIALGLLLLASAWVWQRLKPRGPTQAPHAPSGGA